MDCQHIIELIPDYIEGRLAGEDETLVRSHLHNCPNCREEVREMEKAWQILGEVDDIEPDPDYISRFWARVDDQKPWYENILQHTKALITQRPWIPALAAAGVILVVGGITFRHYNPISEADRGLATLYDVDLDMVEHIDIIESLELIQEIDFLTDLEIIENLEYLEAS
jgi:hypothetical protein